MSNPDVHKGMTFTPEEAVEESNLNSSLPPFSGHLGQRKVHDAPRQSDPAWKATVRKHFPHLVDIADACVSVVCALLLEDLSGCPALVLVGQPSTSKSTALEFIRGDFTYISDNFTPRSFVSHSASVDREELETQVDLLPRLVGKVLMVSDLAPIFGKRADDLQEAMGVLTRVLDGKGYQSDSGVHGQRGYQGDYRFALLGATTLLNAKSWKIMSQLGPRILFLSVPVVVETEKEQLEKLFSGTTYNQKVEECREAVSGHLNDVWTKHDGFSNAIWPKGTEDPELGMDLVRLANLGTQLRGRVSVEKDNKDQTYEYSAAVFEGSDRYRTMIYNLARGHALSEGRVVLELSDIRLVTAVTLSTAPEERRRLLELVLRSQDAISTMAAASALGCSEPTARLVTDEMIRLGLLMAAGSDSALRYELASDLEWLRKLYDGV